MILQRIVPVLSREEVAEGIFVLRFESKEIAQVSLPGQFVNIKATDGCLPLLRRPFSISRIEDETIELIFSVVGQGTRMLASKRPGDRLDVLGPLGLPFGFRGNYDTALMVAGGLGVAPFPFLTAWLKREEKSVVTFLGARTVHQIASDHLDNLQIATDDGSKGFHGTVVSLLEVYLKSYTVSRPKIFGCGPTPMLKALSEFARSSGIDCELSLEGDMACGVGLCQGCPVERVNGKKKYALVCVEGPTFNCNDIFLS